MFPIVFTIEIYTAGMYISEYHCASSDKDLDDKCIDTLNIYYI